MKTIKKTRYNSKALVLNQSGIPIDVFNWEESVISCYTGKAISLHNYPDMYVTTGYNAITGISELIPVPSVIQMPSAPSDKVQYVRSLQPTRENLLKRENGKCCYCRCRLTYEDATIEHVYPESRGGLSDWINCRMACGSCNRRKGDKLLHELGWVLKDIGIPTLSKDAAKSIINKVGGRILDESWRPYINWEVKWK